MNALWELLQGAARDCGDGPFLTDLRSGKNFSYGELLSRSERAGAWLASRGVGVGDRVGYVTKNDPAFFELLFGCACRGAALVPINQDGTLAEITGVLEDCEPKVVLSDLPNEQGWTLLDPDLFEGLSAGAVEECAPEQDAILVYTSGTTGRSKGVILSHKSLIAMAGTLASVYDYQPGQRFLSMLPNYHINAPVVTGLACITGRSHVFVIDPYGFTNARFIFRFVEENKLAVLSLTPSIMASLLKFNPGGSDSDLSSVRHGLVGTAHLPEDLWIQFEEKFGFPCYQGYGLTETTTWATMTPPDERKRRDSAGVAIGCEVRIDEEGGDEILIRGDIVMNGYNRRKALTKKQFKGDWFRTGDIGRVDEDGNLFITGRIKNIIKRRGILISPEEIDGVLRSFPETTDACTVGVPDDLFGERVVSACVIEDEGIEALAAYTRKTLSAYKHPDEFLVVREIPKTGMGKQDLKELRKLVTGEKCQEIAGSFDVYRFRRAQTLDMPIIRDKIQAALLGGGSVNFVGFWGVGSRRESATPDVAALDRLEQFVSAIDAAAGRKLASMTLILADIHARCNQVSVDVYEPYLEAIRLLAEERGLKTMRLSEIWSENQLELDGVLERMSNPDWVGKWEGFSLHENFLQQASHRCVGDDSVVEEYAYRYFVTICAENPVLEEVFADDIFVTYNGPEFRIALPQLPMFHLHSTKPGTAAKPWFLD